MVTNNYDKVYIVTLHKGLCSYLAQRFNPFVPEVTKYGYLIT